MERRYRAAKERHERSWWQILWLRAQGRTATELASVPGYSAYWIGQIARRYNTRGPTGRHTRHHTPARQEELREALAGPAPEDDRWSGRTVAEWMTARVGRPVARARLDLPAAAPAAAPPRRPSAAAPPRRPSAAACGGRPPRARGLQKKVRPRVRAVATAFPQATVELWAMDEQRLGRKPLLRRVWTPGGGPRPPARVPHRFAWRWLGGFVHPASGRTGFHLAAAVSTRRFETELAAFAQQAGAGPTQPIMLVLDQAGWHTPPPRQVPAHLPLLFLPPYSPELQPAEHLWPLTTTVLSTRHCADREDLDDAQARRCVILQQRRALIRSATRFHWWPLRLQKRQGPKTP